MNHCITCPSMIKRLRLLVYLVCLVWGVLPAPSAPAATAATTTRVLCLGDSLTEGLGVAREAAWPALVEAALTRSGRTDVVIINAGVSGSTSASGLSRLKWHLKGANKPAIMILALGANDGLRGTDLKSTRQHLLEVIQLAKAQQIKVLLAGMEIPPNYGPAYTAEFHRLFPELAKDEKVELMPFLLEGVAADKTLNQADGIHPNEAGHKLVAKTVLKYLLPLLLPK